MYRPAGDALQISKSMYESGLVEFCTPNFLIKAIAAHDAEKHQSSQLDKNAVSYPLNQEWKSAGTNIDPPQYIPNDTYFNQQWYLHNTGQGTNDGRSTTPNADIDAPEAWMITKGSPTIVIAVIDQGVTSDHPDLPNSRQVRLDGANFAYQNDGTDDPNNLNPTVTTFLSKSHGNACAGIIAATQDNGIGVTGIAPLCKIMPIKIPLGPGTIISLYVITI